MANNLYEYYTGQGQALPSVADRQSKATEAGITNYTGTSDQNKSLLGYLQGTPSNGNVISSDNLNPPAPLKNPEVKPSNDTAGMNSSITSLLKSTKEQITADQTAYDAQSKEYTDSIKNTPTDLQTKNDAIIKDSGADNLKKQADSLSSEMEAIQFDTKEKISELKRTNPEGLSSFALQAKVNKIQEDADLRLARKGIALSGISRQYETASTIANRAIQTNADIQKAELESRKFVLEQLGTKLATEKAQSFTLQIKAIDNETELIKDAIKTAKDGMTAGSISGDVGGEALQKLVGGKISLSDFYKEINSNPTSPIGSNIAGYDITSYATDPLHEQKVMGIYSAIPFISNAVSAQSTIDRLSPNSPITGMMVMSSATKYGVDPSLMIAIMQQDSSLGTAGLAVKTKNAGNVGNNDSGATKTFKDWGEGVDAVANWLSKHPAQNTSTDYIFGDFTKTLDPQGANVFDKLGSSDKTTVMQLVSGDALIADLVRSRGSAGTKEIERLTNIAKQVDPAFSINQNKIKYEAKKKWNDPNGKASLTRSAMNTAMSHMAITYESSKLLGNTEIPKWNEVSNWISKNTGNPALTNFVYDLTALAGEVASAYKNGTAPTDQETEKFYNAMSGNMSPEQLQGVFTQASQLMSGKLKSLAQEYKQTTGAYPSDPIIHPSVLEELKKSGVNTDSIDALLQEQGYNNNSVNYDTGLALNLAQLGITDGGNNTLYIPRTQWSKLTATHDPASGLSRADAILKTLKDQGYNLLVK